MLTKLFDNTNPCSLANKFRRKRFRLFLKLIEDIPKPVKILDVGGTETFWKMMGLTGEKDVNVTIVNVEDIHISLSNFRYIKCDARDLSRFAAREFDVVFSNSVIEHVGDDKEQEKMAVEIQRVGKYYFVQTPNYYFPFEPHFMFPFFQFLPVILRVCLVENFNMGAYKRCSSRAEARLMVESINLMTPRKFEALFKNGKLIREKFLLLTKSLLEVGGNTTGDTLKG